MKMSHIAFVLACSLALPTHSYAFGLKDIAKEIGPDYDDCDGSNHKSRCKAKETLKSAAKVAAITLAAKLVYDMVVDYQSKKVQDQNEVVSRYLKTHKTLPKQAQVVQYDSSIKPGQVITLGKQTMVASSIELVPAKKGGSARIEEQIEIFDIEGDKQVITSMRKAVNTGEQLGGVYDNQFAFTFPEGMPQGVYKVKTAVFVDEQEQKESRQEFQVVMVPSSFMLNIASAQ